jgi:hypothetical protein
MALDAALGYQEADVIHGHCYVGRETGASGVRERMILGPEQIGWNALRHPAHAMDRIGQQMAKEGKLKHCL